MKNLNNITTMLLLAVISLWTVNISAQPKNAEILTGEKVSSQLLSTQPIRRDMFLDDTLNKIIAGEGYVDSVVKKNQYKKSFMVTVHDSKADKANIIYHVYTNDEEYVRVLVKGDTFEFKGQFVLYTPLNSRRDAYIFDIVLEDGSLVVE